MRNKIRYKKTCIWGLLCISVCFIMIFPLYGLGIENKYLPLMIMMGLSPLVVIFDGYKPDKNLALLLGILFIMFMAGKVFHPETFRMNSYVYTISFFVLFLSYDVVIQKNAIPIKTLEKFFRYLIYAYALVLLIQQLEVLVGIEKPINLTMFGGREENPFKLNSLAIEPSNVGRIMPCVMFCWMKIQEILRNESKYMYKHIWKEDKKIWILFLYVTLGCGSMTSFFSVVVLFLYFVNKKNIKYLPFILLFGGGLILGLMKASPKMNERIENLFKVNYSSADMIVDTDASSSARIVPFIIYFNSIGLDSGTILGHGMDALEKESTYLIVTPERIANDDRVGANNIFGLLYNYGIFCGILFFIFLFRNISPKFISYETLFYFLIFIVQYINDFVLWGFILCMMTIKKYNLIYRK